MKVAKVRLTLVIVSLASLGVLIRGYTQLGDISNWPTTSGVIVSYETGSHSTISYSKYRMQSAESEGGNWIEYEYIVDGVTYTGNRTSPNIKATIPRLRKEEIIPVYYNPSNHSESYLLAQRYYNPLLLGLLVASIVGLGVDLLYYGRRAETESSNDGS